MQSQLKIGQSVMVRWTNCNRLYEGTGQIAKINQRSIRVRLSKDVPSQVGESPYPAGREIVVPIPGTQYNCVIEDSTTALLEEYWKAGCQCRANSIELCDLANVPKGLSLNRLDELFPKVYTP